MIIPDNQTKINTKVLPGVVTDWSACKSWVQTLLSAFTFGILSSITTATPVLGAEEIELFYPPFGEFSISTASLEVFAKQVDILPILSRKAGWGECQLAANSK